MPKKITFIASPVLPTYHDLPKDWKDGDTRTVSDERVKYLTETFPDNFVTPEELKQRADQSAVEAKAKAETDKGAGEKAQAPDFNKAQTAPKFNK